MARKTARLPSRDSLSNLAASLGAGKDKAAGDAFMLACLPRDQVEAMYRGDWLARKVVDIVPYDCVREWREWQGARAAVTAIEGVERRLGLRKAVQRAMILGRLYGGGAIVVGTDEEDPASLARPLVPEALGPGGIRFLHVVSRWQLGVSETVSDPMDPFYGEPARYALTAPQRGELVLHPSRVVRFLGNPLPDPLLAGTQAWSDSVLQALYDAVHAVALTAAGATSLMHEAKVDVVTVPNLSEHLSNAATTAQLSQRFSYAASMKSINNLLLLGDGESWARQRVDFSGLPEMVRTFLQMAAGAADIPVTRLLGQSPAGLSATGDSDTRAPGKSGSPEEPPAKPGVTEPGKGSPPEERAEKPGQEERSATPPDDGDRAPSAVTHGFAGKNASRVAESNDRARLDGRADRGGDCEWASVPG